MSGQGSRNQRRGGKMGMGMVGLLEVARGFWGLVGGEGRICELFERRWRGGRMLKAQAARWWEERRALGCLTLVVKQMDL